MCAAHPAILQDAGIEATTSGTPQFAAPHERIPIGPGPQNVGFHVAGALSHPGDSHSFVETMPILAMPFAAPWGSLVAGVDRTRLVGPRYVIPIHDWFLSAGGRDDSPFSHQQTGASRRNSAQASWG